MPSFWFKSPSLLIWFIIKASWLVSLIFWKCTSTHNTSLLNNFLWLICPSGWRTFLQVLALSCVSCLIFCHLLTGALCSYHIKVPALPVLLSLPSGEIQNISRTPTRMKPMTLQTNTLGHSAEFQLWLQLPAPWSWFSSWGTSADPSRGP